MPYKDPVKQLEYQKRWMSKRREDWLTDKSCVQCGAVENLELDHIDPATKVDHRIWSWSKARRDVELAKCQVLCQDCHVIKSVEDMPVTRGFVAYTHGTVSMYRKHKCRCDLCRAAHRDDFRRWRAQVKARLG